MRSAQLGVWCALLFIASPIAAQSRGYDFELSAGVAPTTQALSASAPLAAVVRFGIVQRRDTRAYRFRLDGDAVFARPEAGTGADRRLRAAGVTYGVLVGPAQRAIAPYATAGVGLTGTAGEGDGWPWLWLTARTGAGVRWRVGDQRLLAEVSVVSVRSSRSHLSRRALLWPITLGVAF